MSVLYSITEDGRRYLSMLGRLDSSSWDKQVLLHLACLEPLTFWEMWVEGFGSSGISKFEYQKVLRELVSDGFVRKMQTT